MNIIRIAIVISHLTTHAMQIKSLLDMAVVKTVDCAQIGNESIISGVGGLPFDLKEKVIDEFIERRQWALATKLVATLPKVLTLLSRKEALLAQAKADKTDLKIIDIYTKQTISKRTIPQGRQLRTLKYSPKNGCIAACKEGTNTILLFDAELQEIAQFENTQLIGGIEEIYFSPNGQYMWAQTPAAQTICWDLQQMTEYKVFTSDLAVRLAFSLDSKLAAVGMQSRQHAWQVARLQLIEPGIDKEIATCFFPQEYINRMQFSPSGQFIACCTQPMGAASSALGTFKLLKINNNEIDIIVDIPGAMRNDSDLAFSIYGAYIIFADGVQQALRIWNMNTMQMEQTVLRDVECCLHFSLDHNYILACSRQTTMWPMSIDAIKDSLIKKIYKEEREIEGSPGNEASEGSPLTTLSELTFKDVLLFDDQTNIPSAPCNAPASSRMYSGIEGD